MSLEFSRRSFLKYSAAAAVMVSCSGLLTACSDPNKPVLNKTGTQTLLMATTTVNAPTVSGSRVTVPITIKSDRSNDRLLRAENFQVTVMNGDTLKYSSDWSSSSLSLSIKVSGDNNVYKLYRIKKGQTVNCALSFDVSLSAGDTLTIKYYPNYPEQVEYYATWNLKQS